MKFSYAIDPARRMVFLRYAGAFTLTRLIACTRRLWADPGYQRSYGGLVDLSDGSLNVAISDLRALIDFLRNQPEATEGRWAVVAASPLATACGILYQKACADRHVLEIFASHEAAANFLRLDGEPPALRECLSD